jgi:hypothetical protein
MSLDEKEHRGRNKSKSPQPDGKGRKASLSPTKGKLMDQSNGDARGAKGRLAKQQSLPQEPTEPKARGRLRKQAFHFIALNACLC